jgi:hypothetical protein
VAIGLGVTHHRGRGRARLAPRVPPSDNYDIEHTHDTSMCFT